MFPRSVLAAILAVSAGISQAPVTAQQVPPCLPPGGVPMMGPPPGACDPYATPGLPIWGGQPSAIAPPPMMVQPPVLALPHLQSADRFWIRGEYLWWWTKGMEAPPLVTSSPAGTPQARAGVLGDPATEVLFGGDELNDDAANGVRLRSGLWLTPQKSLALEAEYFQLFGQEESFAASGDGTTILGRPFFDVTNDRETAQLVSFPGLVAGEVQAISETELRSLLINGRVALIPPTGAVYGNVDPPSRVDWILGYRHLELSDELVIQDELESLIVTAPGSIVASESFATSNTFHGVQLGVVHHTNLNRLWLESMLRVAIGNNTQEVRVGGTTAITEGGVTETYSGNLLAQRSNIGTREETELAMIPEIGLTLGLRITDRLHATVGYSMLYFPNVVRASEQIDTDVNPNLIPPEVDPFTGSLRPRSLFDETTYWAHGLSVGGELRF